jgi:predicted metal-dependent hydrolase
VGRLGSHPKKARPSTSELCGDDPPAGLVRGIEEFNSGQFFEQHETLEELWIAENDSVRYLYQGILQVGVGFYHWSRGNWRGAVAKLSQGLEKLEPYRPVCQKVDVDRLIAETIPLLRDLRRHGPADLPAFPDRLPRIHLAA